MSGIDFLRIREKTLKLNLVLKKCSKLKVVQSPQRNNVRKTLMPRPIAFICGSRSRCRRRLRAFFLCFHLVLKYIPKLTFRADWLSVGAN